MKKYYLVSFHAISKDKTISVNGNFYHRTTGMLNHEQLKEGALSSVGDPLITSIVIMGIYLVGGIEELKLFDPELAERFIENETRNH